MSASERRLEEEKVHQFLLGLEDTLYATVHSSLISQDPFPRLKKAFSTIVQEERLRLMTQSKDPVGEMSFVVQTPLGFSGVRPVAASTGNGVLALAASSVSPNFGRGVGSTPPAFGSGSRPFCTHCNRANHTTQTCYRLHGFLEGWSRGGRHGRGRGNTKSQHGDGAQAGGVGVFVPNVAAANTMMASPIPGAGADGGWRVYDLESGEFIVSRDVSFSESLFTYFAKTHLPPSSSIVDSPPIIDDDDFTAIV
ncbi:Unknown protein [Striga hermonthica]|uniref:Uncharacterized protein n=1 Tax=Striga hermonthica TaxID=68872 RepID=A0A9N7MWU8_STRHE|nr:Unknown protein [Striga hermonthica]